MSTENFKLLGTRVLLTRPVRPKSSIQLTPEAEAELDREMMDKWTALEVFATGDEVTQVKAGQKVYVPVNYLQHAEVVVFGEEQKMLIAERDIAIVW
jgi:hypothetical protein